MYVLNEGNICNVKGYIDESVMKKLIEEISQDNLLSPAILTKNNITYRYKHLLLKMLNSSVQEDEKVFLSYLKRSLEILTRYKNKEEYVETIADTSKYMQTKREIEIAKKILATLKFRINPVISEDDLEDSIDKLSIPFFELKYGKSLVRYRTVLKRARNNSKFLKDNNINLVPPTKKPKRFFLKVNK